MRGVTPRGPVFSLNPQVYDRSHTTTPLDFAVQGADTRLTGVEVQQQGDVDDGQGGGEGGRELQVVVLVEFLAEAS